jgi:hypothetical protein
MRTRNGPTAVTGDRANIESAGCNFDNPKVQPPLVGDL